MNKAILGLCFTSGLIFSSGNSFALTDTYYATGEDLDYLIESDNTLAIREIEYELRKFILFRKVEDYIYSLSDPSDNSKGNN